MNSILNKLLNTGDVKSYRTLMLTHEGVDVAYVTEYKMNSLLGEFVWYTTWKHPDCNNKLLLSIASIYIHDARARVYFPAFLDSRIPPENREQPQLSELMEKFGLEEYDKFDFIIATKGSSPIKWGTVKEVEHRHCDIEEIHAIEEIWEEYNRDLN